ncbi:hypothetical protein [Tautonia sociabilis]|uniref:Uncharacterized protein n=1 Tax=Tautonia sociabilis TaxID=2080755 RepID=A0A432MHI7_9BACT|nr:hypothetical protein [Tautonia sociabilis]RUL86284.1 hypothetical protein TsocGM_16255 [Tautonia sociabilis]
MGTIATAIAAILLSNPALTMPQGPPHGRGPGGLGLHGGPMGRGLGMMARGMSAEEHGNIHALLSAHETIERTVEEIPGGVLTRTVTSDPALVDVLREHVRQMSARLDRGRPVRMWDPVFRDVFAHADAITMAWEEIEGGIAVSETSDDPEVVPLIRAHAKTVNAFVAGGFEEARPPWAGRGMGERQP